MHVKAVYTILNGFWIHSSAGFWILKAGFWIPMPSIPDSTSKNFLDSGIRITLHGAILTLHFIVMVLLFTFILHVGDSHDLVFLGVKFNLPTPCPVI